MKSRVEQSIERHRQGGNCCQSVFCNYADLIGLEESDAFRIGEGFGYGFGGQMEVCGAVSGMTLLAGGKNSSGGAGKEPTKRETYVLVNDMIEQFKQNNGSALCRELLGEDGKPKPHICDACIRDACKIVEKTLFYAEERAE